MSAPEAIAVHPVEQFTKEEAAPRLPDAVAVHLAATSFEAWTPGSTAERQYGPIFEAPNTTEALVSSDDRGHETRQPIQRLRRLGALAAAVGGGAVLITGCLPEEESGGTDKAPKAKTLKCNEPYHLPTGAVRISGKVEGETLTYGNFKTIGDKPKYYDKKEGWVGFKASVKTFVQKKGPTKWKVHLSGGTGQGSRITFKCKEVSDKVKED